MTAHQYSCLGNPMHREAWWATVHGVAKMSDTAQQLKSNSKPRCWEPDVSIMRNSPVQWWEMPPAGWFCCCLFAVPRALVSRTPLSHLLCPLEASLREHASCCLLRLHTCPGPSPAAPRVPHLCPNSTSWVRCIFHWFPFWLESSQ